MAGYTETMKALLYNPLGMWPRELCDIYWHQFVLWKYKALYGNMQQQN